PDHVPAPERMEPDLADRPLAPAPGPPVPPHLLQPLAARFGHRPAEHQCGAARRILLPAAVRLHGPHGAAVHGEPPGRGRAGRPPPASGGGAPPRSPRRSGPWGAPAPRRPRAPPARSRPR